MVLSSDDPEAHRKLCTLCATPRDVLIRCQIDTSGKWHLVCPGKCWQSVSGGEIDGNTEHPHYRYGGAWKNKHAGVSAKKPKKKKKQGSKIDKGDANDSQTIEQDEGVTGGSDVVGSDEELQECEKEV